MIECLKYTLRETILKFYLCCISSVLSVQKTLVLYSKIFSVNTSLEMSCITTTCCHREPGDNHQHQLAQSVGVPMCQAMVEYNQCNYSQAVELLYPLRYRIVEIGGSDAQVSFTEMPQPTCSSLLHCFNIQF